MAKIKVQNYTFSKASSQITFTDYNPIRLDSILIIVNETYNHTVLYNFANATLLGTVATNVLTLTGIDTSAMADTDKLLIYYDDGANATTISTVTKAVEQATDWTAVAQNTVVKSAEINCATHEISHLTTQAFLDTTTAHTGTEFIVEVSSNTSGDEDWCEYTRFVGLIGTAVKQDITNNPLAAAGTSVTIGATANFTVGLLVALEDATLVNSELCRITAVAANTSVTLLDGVTNEHANTTDLYNLAMTNIVMLAPSVMRARVIVNNGYDADGSTLNFKLRCSKVTSL
jgi:hypothetical protein